IACPLRSATKPATSITATSWTLPSEDVIEPKYSAAVSAFHRAADAVAAVLAGNSDWGASGVREGQYAVDLEADQVCLDVLYGAGYRVVSEESGATGPPGSET